MKCITLFLLTALGILAILSGQTIVAAQSQEPELVKVTTLNNAIGSISEITSDGRLIVMGNSLGTAEMRLIDVSTGNIIYMTEPSESLWLSPSATHFIVGRSSPRQSRLIELATGKVLYETDGYLDFRGTGALLP